MVIIMAWRPDYVTVPEQRAWQSITHTDRDADIAVAITTASRAVDRHAGRQFGKVDVAETRYYTAVWHRHRRGGARWVITIDDLMDTTGVTVTCTGGVITDYVLEPRNAAAEGKPWERLVVNTTSAVLPTDLADDVAILAPWGWTAVPSAVPMAVRIQAHRFFSRAESPYGISGSPEQGGEMRLLSRLDPDVATSIGSYRRWWVAR